MRCCARWRRRPIAASAITAARPMWRSISPTSSACLAAADQQSVRPPARPTRWRRPARHGKLVRQTWEDKAMQIDHIDHLNLTVSDLDRSLQFYERVLGMRSERMGEGRAALYFGKEKIHLDLAGASAMAGDKRQPAHICF